MASTVNKSGTEAQLRIASLTSDDFDRTGNLSIWRLQRLLTMARFYAYHSPNPDTGKSFLEYDELTKDKYTFMASTRTQVDRSYYALPDQPSLPSLAIKLCLGYVGRSSLSSVAKLVDTESGFVYATNTNQVVIVDKTTRRPSILPDWWKDQYRNQVIEDEKLVIGLTEIPEDRACYSYQMKVSWNDIDAYKHTNYIAYIRFCLDAAMDGVSNGFFSELTSDILLYPVKKMDISFKGESLAGQELVVKCWESEEDRFKIHFDISRDEQTIFQNTIEFYRPQASL